MPQTPHERIAAAGFSAADTAMLIGVFDSVSASHYEHPAVASVIVDSLCMMAGLGTFSPEKLAAYAEHRARLVKGSGGDGERV
jgi:hypothetical protein